MQKITEHRSVFQVLITMCDANLRRPLAMQEASPLELPPAPL